MSTDILSVRSQPLSEERLRSAAKSWHVAATRREEFSVAEPILENIGADEEDSVFYSCRKLDVVHCMTKRDEFFQPKCILTYVAGRSANGLTALTQIEPLIDWATGSSSRSKKLRRIAIFFNLFFGQESVDSEQDYRLGLDWPDRPRATRYMGIGLSQPNGAIARDLRARREWLEKALQNLEMEGLIVPRLKNDRLTFEVKEPWGARSRRKDNTPQQNGLDVWITPVESLTWMLDRARRYFENVTTDSVHSTSLHFDVPIELCNEMVQDMPCGFDGWNVQVFGSPNSQTRAWFAGDTSSRPSGRIPLGGGWYDDSNDGCGFDVSVAETPDGPCIEIGADDARLHDQLAQCASLFDGVEFHPVPQHS